MDSFTVWQHKFYKTARWVRVREKVRRRDGFRCAQCGVLARGRTIVDHITPISPENRGDPAVLYGLDNLQLLCHGCHNRKTFSPVPDYDLAGRAEPSLW